MLHLFYLVKHWLALLNFKSFVACEIPNVKMATKNSTSIVAHQTTVKYSCEMYHKAEGKTVRKCVNGKIEPSFHSNPLACTSKLNKIISLYGN